MGKFNFTDYQEKLTEKQLQFGEFKPIQPERGFGNKGVTNPLVTVDKKRIAFNGPSMEIITKYGRYVEYMVKRGFLVMRILEKKSEAAYTLNIHKKGRYAMVSGQTVLKYLQENTDLVNLNIFRYRFELMQDAENVFYIDLANAYDKKLTK